MTYNPLPVQQTLQEPKTGVRSLCGRVAVDHVSNLLYFIPLSLIEHLVALHAPFRQHEYPTN